MASGAAHPEGFERVNAALLRHFAERVRAQGGHAESLLECAGVPAHVLQDDGASLTYPQAIRLLDAAARLLRCPDFGMRLARRQAGGAVLGPLGRAMRSARTFGGALRFAISHSDAHSSAAKLWLRPLPEEGRVFVAHELLTGDVARRAQVMEQILLLGHLEAIGMTGGAARGRLIHFRHEAVSPPEVYRRRFGCEVRFGEPVDGITFASEDLDSPITGGSEAIHGAAAAHIARAFPRRDAPVEAEVRGVIARRLAFGDCSSGEVARALNLHPRTLHRRLRAGGRNFQSVKDEVRQGLTRYYLEQTALDFREISAKLGFAEPSIFSRSCRRWFGGSPTQLRRGAQAEAPSMAFPPAQAGPASGGGARGSHASTSSA
ncbi:AraC family transcriptional regulator [Novosphingobium soli]|uniref:AraC family transcriptional regulator n=1 Tax=Novosphingobium soli TaxID=574956 RepID=A0ABV6CUE4_9SPHN